MPTYEYACPKCGTFDYFQSMKDEPLARCPVCRRKVKRLIGTGAGILFKGSGFYQTDYRSESFKKAAKLDSASPSSVSPASSDTKNGAASASKGEKPSAPAKAAT